jgi:hypothetical protein
VGVEVGPLTCPEIDRQRLPCIAIKVPDKELVTLDYASREQLSKPIDVAD